MSIILPNQKIISPNNRRQRFFSPGGIALPNFSLVGASYTPYNSNVAAGAVAPPPGNVGDLIIVGGISSGVTGGGYTYTNHVFIRTGWKIATGSDTPSFVTGGDGYFSAFARFRITEPGTVTQIVNSPATQSNISGSICGGFPNQTGTYSNALELVLTGRGNNSGYNPAVDDERFATDCFSTPGVFPTGSLIFACGGQAGYSTPSTGRWRVAAMGYRVGSPVAHSNNFAQVTNSKGPFITTASGSVRFAMV